MVIVRDEKIPWSVKKGLWTRRFTPRSAEDHLFSINPTLFNLRAFSFPLILLCATLCRTLCNSVVVLLRLFLTTELHGV